MALSKEIVEKFEKLVVQVQTKLATGTGFYVKKYNLIITNHHVINGVTEVVCQTFSQDKIKAEIIYLDPFMDVAFLRPEKALEAADDVEFLSPRHLEIGSAVTAIGHPHGLKFTSTRGIISKVSRLFSGVKYVQTDAAINPGNSGGPLIDDDGNIIGINTFIISESNNLGFALHIDQVLDHLNMTQSVKKSLYLCPSCSNNLIIVGKFCPFCGEELPDNLPVDIEGFDHIPPEVIIENTLNDLGFNPVHSRRGLNFWQFEQNDLSFQLFINQEGVIVGEVALGKIPKKEILELYEFLLVKNSEIGTELRFGTGLKHIILTFSMNSVSLNDDHLVETINLFVINGLAYHKILREEFHCENPDIDDDDR
jgi:serine protease Do